MANKSTTYNEIAVSIVITAYQKAKYLPRALQSVLNQTLKELDIIVVDDGSTDNTREIVAQYAFIDSRVRYIYQPNQGPGSARNTGIRNAMADHIALLDGDDVWLPDKLQYQSDVMKKHPAIDLLLGDCNFIKSTEDMQEEIKTSYFYDFICAKYDTTQIPEYPEVYMITDNEIAAKILIKNAFLPSTVMLRKKAWSTVGGFNEELRGPEDLDFWVRAALVGCQFAYSRRVSVLYYKNETSLVQNSEKTYLEQLKHALYAYNSPEYEPVRRATKTLLHQRFFELIAYYTLAGQPNNAWATFRQSTTYGIQSKPLALACSSFIGPTPLRVYSDLRRRMVAKKT